ncbi:MAG TPA: hypothetical protein VGE74_12850 [Gemmata sp.]
MLHTLTIGYSRAGESIAKSVPIDAEGEQGFDVVVPGSTTDKEVTVTVDVSALALVFITTDQTVTVKTNSSGSPDETLTVTADKPLLWYTGCGWDNPFETDITKLYLTRGAAGDATVNARYAYDATP